jgi:hypothetical protein
MTKEKKSGRRNIRFKPEIGAYAEIGSVTDGKFVLAKAALIVDESYSGVGLIIIDDAHIVPGFECYIKIGDLGPLKGRVVWKRNLEDNAARIGLNFLD